MLKKIAVLAAFIFAAIPLAPSATAWDEACVKFPLWKTAFTGRFVVAHGRGLSRTPPNYIPDPDNPGFSVRVPDHLRGGARGYQGVRGGTHSGVFAANQSQCVDISHIPAGEEFIVFVLTTWGNSMAHCPTHPVHHPKVGYTQERGDYKKIWWEAWGAAGSPQCKYWRESN